MDGSLAALFASYLSGLQPGGMQLGPQGPAGMPGAGVTPAAAMPGTPTPASALFNPGPQPGMPGYPQAGAPVPPGGLPNAANMQPGPPMPAPNVPNDPGGTGAHPGPVPVQGGSQWKRPLSQQFRQ